jgi:hypothetical protein
MCAAQGLEAVVYARMFGMTVYGSFTSGFPVKNDRVIFGGRQSALRFDGMFREDEESLGYAPVGLQYGDLVRFPPSGLEGQPVEIMLRGCEGRIVTPAQIGEPDSGGEGDGLKAEPSYWPVVSGRQ